MYHDSLAPEPTLLHNCPHPGVQGFWKSWGPQMLTVLVTVGQLGVPGLPANSQRHPQLMGGPSMCSQPPTAQWAGPGGPGRCLRSLVLSSCQKRASLRLLLVSSSLSPSLASQPPQPRWTPKTKVAPLDGVFLWPQTWACGLQLLPARLRSAGLGYSGFSMTPGPNLSSRKRR